MYYIGIDIGGMSIKGGLMDESGKIFQKKAIPTLAQRHHSEIIRDIAELVKDLAKTQGIAISEIKGVGMGIPGTIDGKAGEIVYSNNINFKNVMIVDEFRKLIDVKTIVNNDANCAALGEVKFGSGKGYRNAVFITLGTGVGSGIVIDGKIFEGNGGAGAEAGHMVIKEGGLLCSCGRKGCWESYASATALIRQTKDAMEEDKNSLMHELVKEKGKISGRTAFDAYKMGDKTAAKVVDKYLNYIAEGLGNMINIFRPDAVMIGGGISNEGDYMVKMIADKTESKCFNGLSRPPVEILRASLLNDAGILGAGALVI